MTFFRGQLLVASPALLDPNFRRSVVLLAEHSEEGAMGVVLSRPSETTVAEALPQLDPLVDPADLVHLGGPVQPSALLVLAEFDDHEAAAAVVFGDVGFVPADTDPGALAAVTRRARAFVGYAGWSAGQLEEELEEESWLVVDPDPGDVFAGGSEELWRSVLDRQGGALALLARMPADPSVN